MILVEFSSTPIEPPPALRFSVLGVAAGIVAGVLMAVGVAAIWNPWRLVILDQFTLVEADRVRTVYNWLQWFDPDQIQREFSACGLQVSELYADVAGRAFDAQADECAVVAVKPLPGG